MLLAAIAVGAGLLIGLLAGGRFRNVRRARLRSVGLLLCGAACELAADRWGSGWVGLAVLLAGFVLLLAFALRNLNLTGMVLIAAGLLSNLVVIAVNQGMPVHGVPAGVSYGPRHHGERPGDHLTGLADVVHVGPLGETVSGGDIVLSVGVATVIVGLLRPPRVRRGEPVGPWTA